MKDISSKVAACGVVPVVVLNDPDKALPVAEALLRGGLPVAEITFRTDAAEESIRRISAHCPDMLVGAGTVLTTEQVDRAVAAGAQFIVCPGFDPEVSSYARNSSYSGLTPGIDFSSYPKSRAFTFGLNVTL